MKYRKKPVVVEATQWFKRGDHPLDYSKTHDGFAGGKLVTFSPEYRKQMQWEGDIVRYYRAPDVDGQTACEHCGDIMHNHGWIDTLEGGHIVCPGDWIITGVKGEHYPCKPDIFEMTYELVGAMDKVELKPCPFCGGDAEIVEIEHGENEGGSCVCCTKCNASGNVEFGFKENFVSNWNIRALESENAAAEREACIKVIESYQIPVGNSPAGELACDWTYDALKQIRDEIRARGVK